MNWVDWIDAINAVAWGPPMLILLAGTGLFLTLGLRFMPQRNIGYGFKMMWRGRRSGAGDEGDISAFNALMTALSATIGTGNIADRKSTRLNSSHVAISYAVFCLKKKKKYTRKQ